MALDGLVVPVESEPVKRRAHVVCELGRAACGVHILQSKPNPKTALSRIEPTEQGGQQRTRMSRSRWGRCKSTDSAGFIVMGDHGSRRSAAQPPGTVPSMLTRRS
jgi:hypothetical protein